MTNNSKLILKITGWAILLHIILIALTILEVFIYSTFISTGHDSQFYEKHAEQSGPYIGILAGFVLTYFITKLLIKKNASSTKQIGVGLPLAYIVLDILILLLSGMDLVDNFLVFSISYVTKVLAGYFAIKTSDIS